MPQHMSMDVEHSVGTPQGEPQAEPCPVPGAQGDNPRSDPGMISRLRSGEGGREGWIFTGG